MRKVAVLRVEQDKRISQELLSHLALLRRDVWESVSIGPGRSRVEETTQAILSSQVAVLLVSANWFSDPLVEYILPMLLIHESIGKTYIIPFLTRPCLYKSSRLACLSPRNTLSVSISSKYVKSQTR